MSERERRALQIVRDALDADDAERTTFVASACGDDAALRARVDELLRRIDASEREAEPAAVDESTDAIVGTRLGPFRVCERIGRGGMGVVYRGQREEADFAQEVALKLIRRGFDFDDVHARFLRERRILARLSHPNLTRFIDGGVAPDGRPWFALEFVRGELLTRWCDARRLGLRERVRLFLDVCAAVQYAHGQLVVHRDLKPANVLVDEHGVVRLLDFGIARLLGGEEDGTLTVVGSRYAFTPEYAAPEQFAASDVGVAADVYSLGVLLFELLSGVLPVTVDRHGGAAAAEHSVRETPPLSLLQAMTQALDTRDDRLARRGSSLRTYRNRVRGDLSRIVAKALEKEPARRYGSVEAFADDLTRWLAGAPVRISGNRLGYRLGKFLARNRVAVALFGVACLALVLGSAGVLLKSREALFEAERANAVQSYLTDLFESATPGAATEDVPDVRELLARGAVRARNDFTGQPRLQAEMLGVLGHIHLQLGLHDEAQALLEQSIALRRQHPGDDRERLADNLVDLARLHRLANRPAEATPLLHAALELIEGRDPKREAFARALLGVVITLSGDAAAGEAQLHRAVALARIAEQPAGLRVADSLNDLGHVLDRAGKTDEALAAYREALALRRARHGEVHVDVSQTLSNIGDALRKAGRLEEAETALREAVSIDARVYARPHPTAAIRLSNLAIVVGGRGDPAEAERLLRQVLSMREAIYGERDPRAARSRINLGAMLAQQEKFAEAVDVLAVADDVLRHAEGEWRAERAFVLTNLARAQRELGRYPEAETASLESIALNTALGGPDGLETVNSRAGYGRILLLSGRAQEARAVFEQALAITREKLPPQHPRLVDRQFELADAQVALGDPQAARPLYQAALETGLHALGPGHERVVNVRLAFAAALDLLGDRSAAHAQAQEARKATETLPDSAPLRQRAAALERALRP